MHACHVRWYLVVVKFWDDNVFVSKLIKTANTFNINVL